MELGKLLLLYLLLTTHRQIEDRYTHSDLMVPVVLPLVDTSYTEAESRTFFQTIFGAWLFEKKCAMQNPSPSLAKLFGYAHAHLAIEAPLVIASVLRAPPSQSPYVYTINLNAPSYLICCFKLTQFHISFLFVHFY